MKLGTLSIKDSDNNLHKITLTPASGARATRTNPVFAAAAAGAGAGAAVGMSAEVDLALTALSTWVESMSEILCGRLTPPTSEAAKISYMDSCLE
jgi:hypothetical protein